MALDSMLEIQQLLASLIQTNSELNETLKQDLGYFKTNDFDSIEKSNLKKDELHQKIWDLLSQIDGHEILSGHQGNHLERIRSYSSTLAHEKQSEMTHLIDEAKVLWEEGYHLVMANATIVDSNLTYAKDLIHNIVNQTENKSSKTYDKSANIR